MNFPRCCAFVLFFLFSICRTQRFNFNACSSTVNDRLDVTYGSLTVECNTKYDRLLVTPPPKITFSHAVQEKFWMIDPDAPSAKNPKCRSWLHMMLSNVKGSDLQNGISVNGLHESVVTEYNPPTPPKGKGYHRYILAAFSHEEPLHLNKQDDVSSERCGFDIDEFTKANHLHQTPDASIMFQTITE